MNFFAFCESVKDSIVKKLRGFNLFSTSTANLPGSANLHYYYGGMADYLNVERIKHVPEVVGKAQECLENFLTLTINYQKILSTGFSYGDSDQSLLLETQKPRSDDQKKFLEDLRLTLYKIQKQMRKEGYTPYTEAKKTMMFLQGIKHWYDNHVKEITLNDGSRYMMKKVFAKFTKENPAFKILFSPSCFACCDAIDASGTHLDLKPEWKEPLQNTKSKMIKANAYALMGYLATFAPRDAYPNIRLARQYTHKSIAVVTSLVANRRIDKKSKKLRFIDRITKAIANAFKLNSDAAGQKLANYLEGRMQQHFQQRYSSRSIFAFWKGKQQEQEQELETIVDIRSGLNSAKGFSDVYEVFSTKDKPEGFTRENNPTFFACKELAAKAQKQFCSMANVHREFTEIENPNGRFIHPILSRLC